MGLRLLVQPVDSVVPLVQAIDGVELVGRMVTTVNRGVFVHA